MCFGGRRNVAGKDPFIKPSRVNNVTARPRALLRNHSLSVFTAGQSGSGIYTFAQSSRLLNMAAAKGKLGMGGVRAASGAGADETLFGAGLFSAIAAGVKLDRMQGKGKLTGAVFDKFGKNIERLATANNPSFIAARTMDDGMAAIRAGQKGVAGNMMASVMGRSWYSNVCSDMLEEH